MQDQAMQVWRFFLLLILLSTTANGDSSIFSEAMESTLDNAAQGYLQCQHMASFTVVIVNKTSTLLAKGYGPKKVGGSGMVNSDTLYNVGSITKSMFATTIGVILERTKDTNGYTFDTSVREILGEEVEFANDILTYEVTLRDLLAHRTAIPSYLWSIAQDDFTPDKVFDLLPLMENINGLRNQFVFTNYMYTVAARAMETITGEPWRDTMRSVLFGPLGMTSSTFLSDVSDTDPNLVSPALNDRMTGEIYSQSWAVHRVMQRAVSPAAEVVSSGNDMGKYLRCVLNHGVGDDGTQVVPSSVLDAVYTVSNSAPPISRSMLTDAPLPKDFNIGYGLGIYLGLYTGRRSLTHKGSIFGQENRLRLLPEQGLAVHVSGSGQQGIGTLSFGQTGVDILAELALDLLTGVASPSPGSNISCPPWQPPTIVSVPPARNLTAYEGTYGNPIYNDVVVFIENSNLKVKYGPLFVWRALATGPDIFDLEPDSVFNSAVFVQRSVTFTFEDDIATQVTFPTFAKFYNAVFERDYQEESSENSSSRSD